MADRESRVNAAREEEDEPGTKKPRTKKELARRSDGDEIGGEEHGRGAPTENPGQFEEFTGTEPEPDPPGGGEAGERTPRRD